MKKIELIFKSTLAGVLIGLAACIFAGCSSLVAAPWGKVIGAGLFSIGLSLVIFFQTYLYTGKIGKLGETEKISNLLIGLVFNLLGAGLIGIMFGLVNPDLKEAAVNIINSRPDINKWYLSLVYGIGCGICVYGAVEGYKLTKHILIIILPVMAFILAGFPHCIAEFSYLSIALFNEPIYLVNILLVIIGNSIGAILINMLRRVYTKKSLD